MKSRNQEQNLTLILEYLKRLDDKMDTITFSFQEKILSVERRVINIENAITQNVTVEKSLKQAVNGAGVFNTADKHNSPSFRNHNAEEKYFQENISNDDQEIALQEAVMNESNLVKKSEAHNESSKVIKEKKRNFQSVDQSSELHKLAASNVNEKQQHHSKSREEGKKNVNRYGSRERDVNNFNSYKKIHSTNYDNFSTGNNQDTRVQNTNQSYHNSISYYERSLGRREHPEVNTNVQMNVTNKSNRERDMSKSVGKNVNSSQYVNKNMQAEGYFMSNNNEEVEQRSNLNRQMGALEIEERKKLIDDEIKRRIEETKNSENSNCVSPIKPLSKVDNDTSQ